jgi:hypothetical protein
MGKDAPVPGLARHEPIGVDVGVEGGPIGSPLEPDEDLSHGLRDPLDARDSRYHSVGEEAAHDDRPIEGIALPASASHRKFPS